jgi:hypothetical protein
MNTWRPGHLPGVRCMALMNANRPLEESQQMGDTEELQSEEVFLTTARCCHLRI